MSLTNSGSRCDSALLLPIVLVLLGVAFNGAPCRAGSVTGEPDSGLAETLGLDTSFFMSTEALVVLGVASLGTVWSWEESDEAFPKLQESLDGGFLDVPADWGNVYGSGCVAGSCSVGLWATGALTDHAKVKEAGVDLGRSFIYSSTFTAILKGAINRTRPSGGPYSFPSGHTTAAFSTVPVAWHYGGGRLGIPTTLLATMTAVGRMEENRHYLSDVIAGAAIGYLVGRAVISRRARTNSRVQLVASAHGAALVWRF
jgi:hypothetical protein